LDTTKVTFLQRTFYFKIVWTVMISVGHDDQDGAIIDSNYKRYNLKSNIEVNVNKKLLVGVNLSYINRKTTPLVYELMSSVLSMPPVIPVYEEDGSIGYPGKGASNAAMESDAMNPLIRILAGRESNNSYHTVVSAFGEYTILPTLRLHSTFTGDMENTDGSKFQETYDYGPHRNTLSVLSESYGKSISLSLESYLTYHQKFNGIHDITAMIGQSLITYDARSTSASKAGFPSNENYMRYFDAGTTQDKVSGNRSDHAMLSYFGRLNYSFADKYLFQFNMRADGSSRFGKNNKWGQFPSAALGWRLSEEEFMKGVDWLSNMKLRGSYGVLGTMPSALYGFTSTLSQIKVAMGVNQDPVIGYYPPSPDNYDFKWETIYQTNIGVDLGILKNKLSFTFEYYNKYTKDILQVYPVPLYAGTSGSLTNLGEMKNTGLEFSVTLNDHIGDLYYTVNGNLATLKNRVVKLFDNNAPITSGVNRTEVGRAIGQFYGYVTDGIFQNQSEIDAHKVQPNARPGDIRFKNLDGDDKLDAEDMTFIGNPLPKVTYGGSTAIALIFNIY
jgi:TonB-linked SusC/RagA family outer membrane protein